MLSECSLITVRMFPENLEQIFCQHQGCALYFFRLVALDTNVHIILGT
jgi:hypothetical protein